MALRMMAYAMKRGDIFYAALDPATATELQKARPVIIVSNDIANRSGSLVTIVPLTSNVRRAFPFEVKLSAALVGLSKDSKAMAQQVRTINKQRLSGARRGIVATELMREIDAALRLHLAL